MYKHGNKWGLAAALGLAVLGLGLAKPADAATLSFSAQVFSLDARSGAATVAGYDGFPVGVGFFGVEEHESLRVNYQTNGLPYYVSNVTYTANALTKFVPTGPAAAAIFPTQPVTQPVVEPFGQSSPPGPAVVAPPGPAVFGNRVIQDFGFNLVTDKPDFAQGNNSAEMTYVRIDNAAGEMKGTVSGNSLFDFGGNLAGVPGSTITVTFHRNPTAPASLPLTITLAPAAFSIANTPGDPATGNFGSTGGNFELAVVPEPGALAMLIGLGVSGSAILLRRRRR